jgi:pilus assembly protein Flp/PilA
MLMIKMARRFVQDSSGATAVEYALMVGLIAIAIIISVGLLSGAISQLFGDAHREIQSTLN